MFKKIIQVLGGDPHKREVDRSSRIVDEINSMEKQYEALSDDALRAKTVEFRQRLQDGETLDDLLPEAFAAVREASKRTLGMRHFDVQLIGGMALHNRKIAEMRTGEGKTLVATLPLYLNALLGRGAHLVTVNDYLARRDARWMAPIYQALGMSVGVLQMAARTENGRNAFLVDLSKTSPHEDQHQLRMCLRREAYEADITYGTNSEFGFDYLRDNLTMSLAERVQRGHYYAIVDEVDNILIDEARTPLIISGPAAEDTEWYIKMAQVARALNPEDYEVSEKDRSVSLTEIGEVHVEEILGIAMRDPDRPEDITPEQARLMGYLEQALRAQFLFRKNKDYLVQAGKVIIIDEFTGRLMPGRRWSDGLHQAVEAKEGVKVEAENVTYATITIQNYFRMYEKLAGMSGTALTEAEEFYKIYKLDVLPIPTNLEFQAAKSDSPLVEVSAKDEKGYRYNYFTRRDDPEKKPVFWRRKDYPDVVYRSEEAKLRAITQEIIHHHVTGRPQLVGTTSVEHSERLARRLEAEPVRRLAQTLFIRDAWKEKNKRQDDERAIPELASLNAPIDSLNTGDLRTLARSLDLAMNPEDPANLDRLVRIFDLQEAHKPRLVKVLQGGVPAQVLNARKHDEESMIIARAGGLGMVTIATNMAGRGVDIKLGGELPEDILRDVNRVLENAGYDAYNMTNVERETALGKVDAGQIGIYEEPVRAFLQYMNDMRTVRELGGLHIVGSERHEARRIDNQLRGRAARQGDPGSSRFYLSLEDELMRLFGGQQVEGLLKRLNIDEAYPIESGMVGRLVEQSQERVEGSNFDIRKHLLEYDDVLNSQRKRIYSQRDMIFTKEDLSEDIDDMLSIELKNRIPDSLKDEEGPWKLLAYLEQIQPPIVEYGSLSYPSYTMRLVMNEVRQQMAKSPATASMLRQVLLSVAGKALDAERRHTLDSLKDLLEKSEESLEQAKTERFEAVDTFLDSLEEGATDENGQPRRPQALLEELAGLARLPQLRLSSEHTRLITSAPREVGEVVKPQIETHLLNLTVNRVLYALERRLGEGLEIKSGSLQGLTWDEIARQLTVMVESALDRQADRLLGSGNQIARDLDVILDRVNGAEPDDHQLIQALNQMAQGARMVFDRKSHRQGFVRTTRLNYIYMAAGLMEGMSSSDVAQDVLEHLRGARDVLRLVSGRMEFVRMAQNEITLSQVDEHTRARLEEALGVERLEAIANQPLNTLSAGERDLICDVLGVPLQNGAFRHLLLSVISELWVDYLTRVEALRVSIGLESYAQRDPLVQYKGKASEMFQQLLADIRMGVISRMFLYRPQPSATFLAGQAEGELAAPTANTSPVDTRKKRRRH
ncbi:MAG TPA: hypothetical protein VIO61_01810 [Anaerolineaceae bacterium]